MSKVARYALDDGTEVSFEFDPPSDSYSPAGAAEVVGQIRSAAAPAVEAARTVVDLVRRAAPDEVEVTFGLKVSGKLDWLIARAGTEANFEVTLRWTHPAGAGRTIEGEA